MSKQYKLAALGGTFDHLHKGHRHLLETSFKVADRVIIGLTNQELVQSKVMADIIEPHEVRLEQLKKHVVDNGLELRTEIVPLMDPFGPTIESSEIEVIVVSEQTYSGAEMINKIRFERGLEPLPIEVADLIKDEEDRYISSTSIRQGRIDREGRVYRLLFSNNLMTSVYVRQEVKKPLGRLVGKSQLELLPDLLKNYGRIAIAGDVTTEYFIDKQMSFDCAVIDNMSGRDPVAKKIETPEGWQRIACANRAGMIETKAVDSIVEMLDGYSTVIEVEGEEDLLTLPLVMLMPLGSVVAYGQPDEGIVLVEVTEESKGRIGELVDSVRSGSK